MGGSSPVTAAGAIGRTVTVVSSFRPMARLRPALYGGAMTSFLAEPAVPHAPGPLRRDWVLVAFVVVPGVLEVLLSDDVPWPGVALVAGVAPAVLLPWRRTRRVLVTAVVFGAIVLGD